MAEPGGGGAAADEGLFVVVTPAHNEASHLPALIESVALQTHPPDRWVVVDDRSTDHTPEVLRQAEARGLLEPVTRDHVAGRTFAGKAAAIDAGWQVVRSPEVAYVACVDADIVLPHDFVARVRAAFAAEPRLGITGARYVQHVRGRTEGDGGPDDHVPGAAQVFRREVFEAMGGYAALPYGGIDSVANVAARALGWETRTVDGLVLEHLRPEGSANWSGSLRRQFGRGRRDYDVGGLLSFELLKVAKRATDRPFVIGPLARLAGFGTALARRLPRHTDPAWVAQLQAEQRQRLRELLP